MRISAIRQGSFTSSSRLAYVGKCGSNPQYARLTNKIKQMKTIEQAARDYAKINQHHTNGNYTQAQIRIIKQDCFLHGAEFSNQWYPITRDKDGFATTECLDEMFANLPILVYVGKCVEVVDIDIASDYRGEIERDIRNTSWRPIELPK